MKTAIKVAGMSCANCARHVTEALQSLPGVKEVNVDLQTGKVTFERPAQVTMDEIASVIKEAGYQMEG